jgi:hypothetical protein
VDWRIWENYRQLLQSRQWIPCSKDFAQAEPLVLKMWIQRLSINRMERKAGEIESYLNLTKNKLDESFYYLLAKNFGFFVNSLPFEMLAKSVPLSIIGKHRSSLFQIEALLFGQAGLLEEDLEDPYYASLQKEYAFLQNKFKLQAMPGHLWKFLRLRPSNFPTLRIAQFAALLHQTDRLLSQVAEATSIQTIKEIFKIQPSAYWLSHYRFSKGAKERPKHLGESAIQSILINTVVPMLFELNKQQLGHQLQEKAIQLLEETQAEDNALTRGFEAIGFKAENAVQSQGLIELKQNFCERRKCLECSVGNHLLVKGK